MLAQPAQIKEMIDAEAKANGTDDDDE